jgi:hypothetical protein
VARRLRNDYLVWISCALLMRDEGKAYMTALHLRKRTGAMSIQRERTSLTARGAACACERGYVTNNGSVGKSGRLGVNHQ